MKRIGFLAILVLAGLGLFANGAMAVDMPTFVVGKISGPNGEAIAKANVTVNCNNATEKTESRTETGIYKVQFKKTECGIGSAVTVTACKEGIGCNTGYGTVDKNLKLSVNISIVNVTIPEFGIVAGIATMLASSIGFMLIRKRSLSLRK